MPVYTDTKLDKIPEGELFYLVNSGLFRTHKNNIEWGDDRWTGELLVVPVPGDESDAEPHDAGEVFTYIESGKLYRPSVRVRNDPEGVIMEFARAELSEYKRTLSPGHPYNGIRGVNAIGDLIAAEYLV